MYSIEYEDYTYITDSLFIITIIGAVEGIVLAVKKI